MGSLAVPASIVGTVISSVAGDATKAVASAALSVVNGWVVAGAEAMLREVIAVISLVTTPSLSDSWFSVHYWQVAALAMLLTVPFLFAAAVQAILRSDLSLLLRAALVDLPIATVAVYAAAPVITLLLSATDEMCSLVSGGGPVGGSFLAGLPPDLSRAGNGFLIVIIAVVILFAGLVLLVELLVRSAAIYVVVLFLPLGFAAMVWPARRVWIKRMLETLIALILSKFAMVAILTLAITALASLSQHPTALTTALTAMTLIVIATLSPWALLRLLPFTELAAGAALLLHQDAHQRLPRGQRDAPGAAADVAAGAVVDPVTETVAMLRRYIANSSSNSEDGRDVRQRRLAVLGADEGDHEIGPGAGDEPGPPTRGGAPSSGPSGGSSDGAAGSPPRGGPERGQGGPRARPELIAPVGVEGPPALSAPGPRPSGDQSDATADAGAGLGVVGAGPLGSGPPAPLPGPDPAVSDLHPTLARPDPDLRRDELEQLGGPEFLDLSRSQPGWLTSGDDEEQP